MGISVMLQKGLAGLLMAWWQHAMLQTNRDALNNTALVRAGRGLPAMLQGAAVLRLRPCPWGRALMQPRRRRSVSQGGGASPSRKLLLCHTDFQSGPP